MRISLSSPVRKASFLGGGALVLLAYFCLSCQAFICYWITRTPSVARFTLAAKIDPLDSYYPRALGLYSLDADQANAPYFFDQALRHDAHNARLWLELANAYRLTQQPEKQRAAVLNALENSPKDVPVEWEAANLFLVSGDNATGFKLMSDVAAVDPSRREGAVLSVLRHSDDDATRALTSLPATTEVRQSLFKLLLRQEKYSAADEVWPALMATSGTIDRPAVFTYFDSLIARREVAGASAAWQSFAIHDIDIRKHIAHDGLLSNGDFEVPILNAGFDWRKHSTDGLTLALQRSIFHGGNTALQLDLDTNRVGDGGLLQLVPVEPNSHYRLSAFLRAEELESANGMRLSVSDYYTGANLMFTDELIGSFPWRQSTNEFTTGPDTQLVRISFGRSPDIGRIRGSLWLDDVRLEKK
jgi:hypothetical protein